MLGADPHRTAWAVIDWAKHEDVTERVFLANGTFADPSRWPLDTQQPFTAEHLAGRPGVDADIDGDPRLPHPVKAAMAERGIRAGIAAPVLVDGARRAVLNTGQGAAPRHWLPDEVASVEAFAERAWAEIDRARAKTALRESEAWLGGQEAFQAAMDGAPLDASLGILIRTAVTQAESERRCAFTAANPGGGTLRHVVGMPDDYARQVDGFVISGESLACGLPDRDAGLLTAHIGQRARSRRGYHGPAPSDLEDGWLAKIVPWPVPWLVPWQAAASWWSRTSTSSPSR
ncbi:GAF domain-containing protein [Methylobacterium sp. A49B]